MSACSTPGTKDRLIHLEDIFKCSFYDRTDPCNSTQIASVDDAVLAYSRQGIHGSTFHCILLYLGGLNIHSWRLEWRCPILSRAKRLFARITLRTRRFELREGCQNRVVQLARRLTVHGLKQGIHWGDYSQQNTDTQNSPSGNLYT